MTGYSLTPARQRVLDYLTAEVAEGKPFPSAADVSKFMGWKHKESGHAVLMTLAGQGYIARWRVGTKHRITFGFTVPAGVRGGCGRRVME